MSASDENHDRSTTNFKKTLGKFWESIQKRFDKFWENNKNVDNFEHILKKFKNYSKISN